MLKRGASLQIDLLAVAGQMDDKHLGALLHLQKSLLLKNVETHADLASAAGVSCEACDLAREAAKFFADDAVLRAGS